MSDPFDSVRRKIRRAEEHAKSAYNLINIFVEDKPHKLAFEIGGKGKPRNSISVRVVEVKPLPQDFGILIGDAAHNLRSALDHLMFAMAVPRNEAEEKRVQFPLYPSRAAFRKSAKGRMAGVPRGVLSVVESLQPYHQRKWPETALLGKLREISNWDKHRALPTAIMALAGSKLVLSITNGTEVVQQQLFTGPLVSGAVIARFETANSLEGTKMNVQPHLAVQPIFGVGMPKEIRQTPVLDAIFHSIHFIEGEVLPRFQRFV